MKRKRPGVPPMALAAPAARVLAVAMAALAVWLEGRSMQPTLAYLGAGYVALALLSLPAALTDRSWPAYPLALLDVGAVTLFIVLSPFSALPLWVLYLAPIVGAATVGSGPASLASGLALVGYLSAPWLTTGTVPPGSLWPSALLAAAGFLATGLAGAGLVVRKERRAWREVIAAARILAGGGSEEETATAIVRQARLLARADGAWLWWWDAAGRLTPGPRVGSASEQLKPVGPLAETLVRRLERGPVPLAALGDIFDGLVGDALALHRGGRWVALLLIAWKRSPHGRKRLCDRVRVFAPWAVDSLLQAEARAAAREELRRERVLCQAMAELAATVDGEGARRIVTNAARVGLEADAAIVHRPSGRVVVGDARVSEAVVRWTPGVGDAGPEGATAGLPAGGPDGPLLAPIEDELLVADRRGGRCFEESDRVWLRRLAAPAEVALERCRDHARLAQEERWLRGILGGLPAPLAVRDGAGRLLFANRAHDALGLVMPPDETPLSGPHEEEIEVGDPPRVFVVATVPLERGGSWVSLYREVTREREALRAKEELISFLGHELRNPLTSIQGYSQMMARQLGVVQGQVTQLNRLIGDVLDAARLESGQLVLDQQMVDPTELVLAALERFRGAHPARMIRLKESDAPPILGDPARLGQVLDNLLVNAAKYSPEDREIILGAGTDEDGSAVISVQDFGVGIAPEHLPHLFKRFYRVPDAHTERVKGFGLGLAIVHDLVVAHGGRVWPESAGLGRGSTFWVALPPAPRDEVAPGDSEQATSRL